MLYLKKLFKFVIIIAVAYAVGRFVVVFQGSQLSGYRAPYIQMLTQDSVTIRWMTKESQLGIIRFGEDITHLSEIKLESSPTKNLAGAA